MVQTHKGFKRNIANEVRRCFNGKITRKDKFQLIEATIKAFGEKKIMVSSVTDLTVELKITSLHAEQLIPLVKGRIVDSWAENWYFNDAGYLKSGFISFLKHELRGD